MSDFGSLSATEQAALVRSGEASAVELVDDAINRIEKLNDELNAVIIERFDKARAEAAGELPDGPFRGVPAVLKDLDGASAGDPHHCGMRWLKDIGWVEHEDTNSVAAFRATGAVFVGKSNCSELGLVPTTEPEAYGPARNPWDPTRSTGGSSGGTAAAVASGMVPIGTAGDGGGSIRIPASECGLVGLKPTRGRVSLGPAHGELWNGLVVRGVLTRTVLDTATALDAMSVPAVGEPYYAPPFERPLAQEVGRDPGTLRIGFTTRAPAGMAETQTDAIAATEDAAKLLESLGHGVEESAPAALYDADITDFTLNLIGGNLAQELGHWERRTGETLDMAKLELGTKVFAEMGAGILAKDYLHAVEQVHLLSRKVQQWWADRFNLLLTPTIPEPPPVLGQFAATEENPLNAMLRSATIVPFVAPFNLTGQPGISLPLYWNDSGLPIGVQLVAAYGREDMLIRIAAQLEEARPWRERRPPIS
ncbi:MAG TPA: amidase [Actinomycetota bacterium]|nr:amidase [Actinomycetota bacterium]